MDASATTGAAAPSVFQAVEEGVVGLSDNGGGVSAHHPPPHAQYCHFSAGLEGVAPDTIDWGLCPGCPPLNTSVNQQQQQATTTSLPTTTNATNGYSHAAPHYPCP
jgi:hypothetical protein